MQSLAFEVLAYLFGRRLTNVYNRLSGEVIRANLGWFLECVHGILSLVNGKREKRSRPSVRQVVDVVPRRDLMGGKGFACR